MLLPALIVPIAYLLGTLPTAAVVAGRRGHDPTREGSGNPGASNVYRTAGRRAGAVVLLGDLLKGAAAAGLGLVAGDHLLGLVAGAAAVLGHVAPVFRGGRGGKGAATYGGALLVTFPWLGLGAAAGWGLVTLVAKRPSVASIAMAVLAPVVLGVVGTPGREVAVVAVAGALVVLRHRGNIARLARGTEAPIEAGRR